MASATKVINNTKCIELCPSLWHHGVEGGVCSTTICPSTTTAVPSPSPPNHSPKRKHCHHHSRFHHGHCRFYPRVCHRHHSLTYLVHDRHWSSWSHHTSCPNNPGYTDLAQLTAPRKYAQMCFRSSISPHCSPPVGISLFHLTYPVLDLGEVTVCPCP